MRLSYAVINPKLVSQSSILAHPPHIRWAWLALIIEGQIHDGVLPGLTAFQLSRLATISIQQAEEALRAFLAPDPFSACAANDGRRLELIDADTNTYRLVSFEFQQGLIRKARDAARKRAAYAENVGESAEKSEAKRESPQIPPPLPTPLPTPTEKIETSSDPDGSTTHSGNGRAKPTKAKPESDLEFMGNFEKIWQLYPRHDGKAKSLKLVWAVFQKGGEPELQLLANATGHYAKARRGEDPSFTMIGPTFYGGRWRDWINGDPKPKFNPNRNPRL